MNKKLTISLKDEKVPIPAAVRGSKTPVLKLSNAEVKLLVQLWKCVINEQIEITVISNFVAMAT